MPKGSLGQSTYALTHTDVQRIWSLLVTVRDAISELFDYRRVEPIDDRACFPCEDSLYALSSDILKKIDDKDPLF
jgi:hypothetical protein